MVLAFLTHVSSVLITFVTLAFFTNSENDNGQKFTASRVFSALALFNQLTVPLFIFPITVPIIISAIISTKRLEKFLQLPEVSKKSEGVIHMARVLSRSDASLDVYEKENNENGYLNEIDGTELINYEKCDNNSLSSITNSLCDELSCKKTTSNIQQIPSNRTSIKTTLKKNNQLSMMSIKERNRLRQKTLSNKDIQLGISDDLIVSIKDGIFSWQNNDGDVLKVNKIDIPKGDELNRLKRKFVFIKFTFFLKL